MSLSLSLSASVSICLCLQACNRLIIAQVPLAVGVRRFVQWLLGYRAMLGMQTAPALVGTLGLTPAPGPAPQSSETATAIARHNAAIASRRAEDIAIYRGLTHTLSLTLYTSLSLSLSLFPHISLILCACLSQFSSRR